MAVVVTVLPLASVIDRVTVRPGPTSEVPEIGALATLALFTSSRLTVMLAVVSRVKVRLLLGEVLPATSVWRIRIVLLPSTATGGVVLQVVPSVLYSTVAPGSTPPTL